MELTENRLRLQVGDVFKERYRIVKWLGEGGMGRVFLADDLRLPGKRWAVKETVSFGADAAGFKRETDLLARLHHPRLPQVVDGYPPEENGYAYVVMEYIDGMTLEAALRQMGRFSAEAAIRIGMQLAETLAYLHGQRPEPIIFRDVKPSNIMLDDSGGIRLIDFGIARRYKADREGDTVLLGTIGYAAPEQLRGERTDPRSDLYAVGAVLDVMLRGFSEAANKTEPLGDVLPDVPADLVQLVERLLEERPERRPHSAEEVLNALRRLSSTSGEPHPANFVMSGKEEPAASALQPKLVLIGSLYPGAGSTFTALALAYALDRAGTPHAVCEHPAAAPELYAVLFGERQAPKGYVFAAERIRSAGHPGPAWTRGHTLWVPSHPDSDPDGWESALTFEWLYEVRRPLLICDVSHCWTAPSVSMLLAKADDVLVVVDPTPSKLANARTKALLRRLADADGAGRTRVSWVANRDVPSPRRSSWLAMLPQQTAVSLPVFPADCMLEAQWRGTGIPSERKERDVIERAFAPLLRRWYPEHPISSRKRTSWLQRRAT